MKGSTNKQQPESSEAEETRRVINGYIRDAIDKAEKVILGGV
jgi:hypothetical protein